ncbi:hypothetical protein [Sapientia aquatica]|uniref:Uncharacterized protein n=1 Tax=Sapientia aquatica TaxID=1549640 RepID=A0A4R5VXC8_9BURK|nr:hypothetical protein [Sapientia aquatica]TDK63570.1 hypothetical protein E2I14_15325 [Sapientia aquatica]
MTKHYLGRACKYGHDDGTGHTLRHTGSNQCVECMVDKRKTEEYKEYHAAYHQKLRANNIEKLKQYRQTQIDKGNHNSKYEKDKTK